MDTEREVGKRPVLWQRRKSRGELNQGRERSEKKIFGVRKREVRTKQWEIKKSKLKSPRSMPLKFTKRGTKKIWKHGAPDGTCFSGASPIPLSCLGSWCKFQGSAFHF